jgi:hypothetical protein
VVIYAINVIKSIAEQNMPMLRRQAGICGWARLTKVRSERDLAVGVSF